ncbi:MAG: hypothetical protein MUC57_16925 [Desulfobacterales bacterium]|jgi:hypothetical protein|nr:hypothetical protein [Desulfobacterales bacterium]
MRAEIGKKVAAGGKCIAPAVPDESHSAAVPGGVYLCQVGDAVSCGACCGLYNCADASRGTLEDLIAGRTQAFRRVPRDADAITDFQVRMERRNPGPRPYPDFYHCPFLGFIDAGRRRVGCLLHPMADGNDGIDYRGLSFYGGLACRDYFCPSYRNLAAPHKEIVKAVCADWYFYGLVITEDRLLNAFFSEIEKRLNRSLTMADVLPHADSRQAVLEFLSFKLDWPHRMPGARGPGNYFFNDGLYPKPPIDYARLGVAPSALDPILHELSSGFNRPEAINEAENRIEGLLGRILRPIVPPGPARTC